MLISMPPLVRMMSLRHMKSTWSGRRRILPWLCLGDTVARDKWFKEDIILKLSRQDVSDIAGVFALVQHNDAEFIRRLKDKKLKKIFVDTVKRHHKLWCKLQNAIQG